MIETITQGGKHKITPSARTADADRGLEGFVIPSVSQRLSASDDFVESPTDRAQNFIDNLEAGTDL